MPLILCGQMISVVSPARSQLESLRLRQRYSMGSAQGQSLYSSTCEGSHATEKGRVEGFNASGR